MALINKERMMRMKEDADAFVSRLKEARVSVYKVSVIIPHKITICKVLKNMDISSNLPYRRKPRSLTRS